MKFWPIPWPNIRRFSPLKWSERHFENPIFFRRRKRYFHDPQMVAMKSKITPTTFWKKSFFSTVSSPVTITSIIIDDGWWILDYEFWMMNFGWWTLDDELWMMNLLWVPRVMWPLRSLTRGLSRISVYLRAHNAQGACWNVVHYLLNFVDSLPSWAQVNPN